MKKTILLLGSILSLFGMAVVMSSCSEDDAVAEPFVKLVDNDGKEVKTIQVECLQSTVMLKVESNAEWVAYADDADASWVALSPMSGKGDKELRVDVSGNQATSDRTLKYDFKVSGTTMASLTVTQAAAEPTISVTPDITELESDGGDVTFAVNSNCEWSYTVSTPGVVEKELAADKLTLTFPSVTSKGDVSHKVTFVTAGKKVVVEIVQHGVKGAEITADLLDIEFLADGTAVDRSPMENIVITNPGASLMTYYNAAHNRYVANFRNPMGVSVTEGYYRVNYPKGGDFINRIADGCTLETMIKLNSADNPSAEVKWFSSMQAGGIGFILPIHNANNNGTLTFLPNVSTTGSSNWRWTYSSVKPEVGKYYHVVGVWNKEEGKAYVYVNGVLSGTQTAPGNYVPVASGAESFVIGGDAEPNQTVCASAWDGEIVTARIYDDPLTAEQVSTLWQAAAIDENAQSITVSDLQYMPACEVAPGYKYSIYGNGFNAGDEVELQPVGGGTSCMASTTVTDGRLTFVIPSAMTSGRYKVVLCRGDVQAPLVQVDFTISSNPVAPTAPKVIAHRGAHTDGASENSVAALSKAMDADYHGIELDVWITTDDKLVVHHDGVVNGVRFESSTYDEIKNVTLSNGEKLPTFESFINKFKEKMNASASKLIIEVKTHSSLSRSYAATDLAMKMVDDAGITDRVEFIAFSFDVCKRIAAAKPNMMVGFLSGNMDPADVLAAGVKSVDYSASAYNSHPSWIKDAKKLGMIVNVWTVNSVADMMKFSGQGVDYITTDQPAVLDALNKLKFVEK